MNYKKIIPLGIILLNMFLVGCLDKTGGFNSSASSAPEDSNPTYPGAVEITGFPSGSSSLKRLDLEVSGLKAGFYSYKMGEALDCGDPAGYSEKSSYDDQFISLNIASQKTGEKKICLQIFQKNLDTVPVKSVENSWIVTRVLDFSLGYWNGCYVLDNGKVYCVGRNFYGQLGRSYGIDSYLPEPVSGVSDAVKVRVGDGYACALTSIGIIYCWGSGSNGRLGDGTTVGNSLTKTEAVQVSGITNAVELALNTHGNHACARLTDDTVKCWGTGANGKLGTGNTSDKTTPATVQASLGVNLSGVKQIVTGRDFSCALLTDSTVKCWGYKVNGEVGDNLLNDYNGDATPENYSLYPQQVMTSDDGGASVYPLSFVTELRHGQQSTCALKITGEVRCWGYDPYNRMGSAVSGNTKKVALPSVAATVVKDIGIGNVHTCFLFYGGSVACAGYNGEGQIGNFKSLTTSLNGDNPFYDAEKLYVGYKSTCIERSNGEFRCWGDNSHGFFFSGEPSSKILPTKVGTSLDVFIQVSNSWYHSCGLKADGSVYCWGQAGNRLGSGRSDLPLVNPQMVSGIENASQIAVSDGYSCALKSNGEVYCWGDNGNGQLGDGTSTARSVVNGKVLLAEGATQIALASWAPSACARLNSGKVQCWGYNGCNGGTSGSSREGNCSQLGFQTLSTELGTTPSTGTVNNMTPVTVKDTGGSTDLMGVQSIVGSARAFCALLADKTIKCWGRGEFGEMGNGTTTGTHNATLVSGVNDAEEIVSGERNFCIRTTAGKVKCWGYNGEAQLSDNSTSTRTTPVFAKMNGTTDLTGVTNLLSSRYSGCAVVSGAGVYCWGYNAYRQVGPSISSGYSSTLAKLVSIDYDIGWAANNPASLNHCYRRTASSVHCWGANFSSTIGHDPQFAGPVIVQFAK